MTTRSAATPDADDGRCWQDLQRDLADAGFDSSGHVLATFVYQDLKQNDRRALYLDQPSLGLAREHHLKEGEEGDKRRAAYKKYMVDTAVYFGADPEVAEKQVGAETLNDLAQIMKGTVYFGFF